MIVSSTFSDIYYIFVDTSMKFYIPTILLFALTVALIHTLRMTASK